jgi:hypothetical protein
VSEPSIQRGERWVSRRPLRIRANDQRSDVWALSKASCAHDRFAARIVCRRLVAACRRSSSLAILTSDSAASHSSFHHRTPRGSGECRRLKRVELTWLMSCSSWFAALSSDGMSVMAGGGIPLKRSSQLGRRWSSRA